MTHPTVPSKLARTPRDPLSHVLNPTISKRVASKAPRRDPKAVLEAMQAVRKKELAEDDKTTYIVDLEQESEPNNTPDIEDPIVTSPGEIGKQYAYIIISSVIETYNEEIYNISPTVYTSLTAANDAAKYFEEDFTFSSQVKGKETCQEGFTEDGRWISKASAGGPEVLKIEVLRKEMQVDVSAEGAMKLEQVTLDGKGELHDRMEKSTTEEHELGSNTVSTDGLGSSLSTNRKVTNYVYIVTSAFTDPYNGPTYDVSEAVYTDLETANQAARHFVEQYGIDPPENEESGEDDETDKNEEFEEWGTADGRWGAKMDIGEGVELTVEVIKRAVFGGRPLRHVEGSNVEETSEDERKSLPKPTQPTKNQHAPTINHPIYIVTREFKSNDYNPDPDPLEVVAVYDSAQKANQAVREMVKDEGWKKPKDLDDGSADDEDGSADENEGFHVEWNEILYQRLLTINVEIPNVRSLRVGVENWAIR